MNRDKFIQIMRAELNALRQIFSDCITQMVIMLTEVWRKALIKVIINNFESLLQDKTHDEWLTEKTVIIIMRTDTALVSIFMINLNVWTVYVNNE